MPPPGHLSRTILHHPGSFDSCLEVLPLKFSTLWFIWFLMCIVHFCNVSLVPFSPWKRLIILSTWTFLLPGDITNSERKTLPSHLIDEGWRNDARWIQSFEFNMQNYFGTMRDSFCFCWYCFLLVWKLPSKVPGADGRSRGNLRFQYLQYQSKTSFRQIDSGGLPLVQVQANLFQVLGSGAWKLGCCIPSECTKQDAAKVKVKYEHPKTGSLICRGWKPFWSKWWTKRSSPSNLTCHFMISSLSTATLQMKR